MHPHLLGLHLHIIPDICNCAWHDNFQDDPLTNGKKKQGLHQK